MGFYPSASKRVRIDEYNDYAKFSDLAVSSVSVVYYNKEFIKHLMAETPFFHIKPRDNGILPKPS